MFLWPWGPKPGAVGPAAPSMGADKLDLPLELRLWVLFCSLQYAFLTFPTAWGEVAAISEREGAGTELGLG